MSKWTDERSAREDRQQRNQNIIAVVGVLAGIYAALNGEGLIGGIIFAGTVLWFDGLNKGPFGRHERDRQRAIEDQEQRFAENRKAAKAAEKAERAAAKAAEKAEAKRLADLAEYHRQHPSPPDPEAEEYGFGHRYGPAQTAKRTPKRPKAPKGPRVCECDRPEEGWPVPERFRGHQRWCPIVSGIPTHGWPGDTRGTMGMTIEELREEAALARKNGWTAVHDSIRQVPKVES
jgi:hypothetical protein